MDREEKKKLYLLLFGIIALMVALWFILRVVEMKQPVADIADAKLSFTDFPEASKAPEPVGTVKLGGRKYGYFHRYESYLFLGTDASGNDAPGEEYQGSMADFLLLAVFDRTEDTYAVLQLNRDTMTEVTLLQPDGSGNASAELQLCTAHWYGGTPEASCENTVEAVSGLLGGIPIDGYYALSMEKIPELNHAVGGVTVTLEEDFTEFDRQMAKGKTLTLTDEQAAIYVHNRYGVGDEKNSSRMERQNQYMKAFMEKAKQKLSEDQAFVAKLYQKLEKDAVTDISGKDISRMTKTLQQGESRGIKSFQGKYKLGRALGDNIDHVEFYIKDSSLTEVMTELYGLQGEET